MDKNKDMLELILNRRSCRAYQPEVPSRSTLAAIVEAGRYAPSSRNRQMNKFYVITDPKVLSAISRISAEHLEGWAGKDCLYGAPVLVLVTNRRENICAFQDSACAMENMMLAAASLGVGSCWLNQPFHLRDHEAMLALLDSIGVSREEVACGSLALGYPKGALFPGRQTIRGNAMVWVTGEE